MDPARFERTSEIVKNFQYSCSRLGGSVHSLELELPDLTVIIHGLTRNTYIMVVVHASDMRQCSDTLALHR